MILLQCRFLSLSLSFSFSVKLSKDYLNYVVVVTVVVFRFLTAYVIMTRGSIIVQLVERHRH